MKKVDKLAQILWGYLHVGHELEKADVIIAMGCHDTHVAERAAELFHEKWALYVVTTGGFGGRESFWGTAEADVFADVLIKNRVPDESILRERRSTNTGENVLFTRELLAENGVGIQRVIAVHKPYMERRAYATFRQQWPDVEVIVTSQQVSYDEYDHPYKNKDDFISAVVGDTQRIWRYAEKGFQIEQDVPDEVYDAYEELVKLGYDKHVIENDQL